MTPITDLQWEAYRLCHPDHEGMDIEDAAKELGVTEIVVAYMLGAMKHDYPDLFTDISTDGKRFDYRVSQFGGWCEDDVVKKF